MPGTDEKKDVKVATSKKPTALELERLAARQRLHEANVRAYLVSR